MPQGVTNSKGTPESRGRGERGWQAGATACAHPASSPSWPPPPEPLSMPSPNHTFQQVWNEAGVGA